MDLLYFLAGVLVTLGGFAAARRYLPRLETHLPEVKQLPSARPPALLRVQEKRADILADLYGKLATFHRRLLETSRIQSGEGRIYVGAREATAKEIDQRLEREKAGALDDFRALTEFIETHRLYFESEITQSLDAVLTAFHKLVAQSVGTEILGSRDGSTLKGVAGQIYATLQIVDKRFKALSGMDEH